MYTVDIKSFVKRKGRITNSQRIALDKYYKKHVVNMDGKLNFNDIFGNDNPVVLEIGFGNGQSLLEMAKSQPEVNFLGIEVHEPGIGALLDGIVKDNLTNLKAIEGDAVQILEQIEDLSLSKVQLFFPDPWHKKRHNKRRIVQSKFVELVSSKLNNNGILHLATDWEDYALHMQEVLSQSKLINMYPHTIFVPTDVRTRPLTKFENRGIKLGHGVWDIMYSIGHTLS